MANTREDQRSMETNLVTDSHAKGDHRSMEEMELGYPMLTEASSKSTSLQLPDGNGNTTRLTKRCLVGSVIGVSCVIIVIAIAVAVTSMQTADENSEGESHGPAGKSVYGEHTDLPANTSPDVTTETTTEYIKSVRLACDIAQFTNSSDLYTKNVTDEGRCSTSSPGFYPDTTSCANYYLCCDDGIPGGVGTCPTNYTFHPMTQTCEFTKATFYRDPRDCGGFYRCTDHHLPPRRYSKQSCNTGLYFKMDIPSPTCAYKHQVPDCLVSSLIQNEHHT